MSDYINQPYLKSEHLMRDGEHVSPTLRIVDVLYGAPMVRKGKAFGGIALVFEGKEKVLGLNISNEGLASVACGDGDADKWIGKTIRIEVRDVPYADGTTGPAIRIMPESGTKLRPGLVKALGKAMPPRHP